MTGGRKVDLRRERIGDPNKLVHPAIKIPQYVLDRLCRAVVEDEAEFVAFIARPRLRTPGEIFAVGRVGGVEVAAEGRAYLHRLGLGVGEVESKDVGVGADCRLGVEVFSEGQLLWA